MPEHASSVWPYAEHHPGQFLERRFLQPLGLSASDLSRGIGVPRSRISEILSGKRGITPDTALRLARFFRMEPEFWLGLQGRWDLSRCAAPELIPADVRGFLVGPDGACPIPAEARPTVTSVRVNDDLLARLRAAAALAPEGETRVSKHVQYDSGQHAWVGTRR